MSNLHKYQDQLLQNLRPVDMLKQAKTISATGLAFKEGWLNFLAESASKFTFTAANEFMSQAAKLKHVDPAVGHMYETVSNALNASPLRSKLAIVLEYASLYKHAMYATLSARIEQILGESEEEVKSQLANGIFDSFNSILGMHSVITEASADRVVTATDAIKVYSPIAYTHESANGIITRVGQYVFNVSDKGIQQTSVPDNKFAYMSSIVEFAKYDKANDQFVIESEFGAYVIKNGKISSMTTNESYSSMQFVKRANMIVETKGVNVVASRKVIDAIVSIAENFDNIAELNNCRIAENARFNERIGIFENAGKTIVFVDSSKRYPTQLQEFTSIKEAITRFHALTTIDASPFFKQQLELASVKDDAKLAKIKEHQTIIDTITAKIKNIEESMQKVEKNSDAHKLYIEAIQLANSKIVEQRSKIREITIASK